MTNLCWTYIDPLAKRNIEAERHELGPESLQAGVSRRPAARTDPTSIRWWVLRYEEAGRALMRNRQEQ